MIQAICFDLDGVYFQNGKLNFILSLVNLGVSEAEAKRVFFDSEQMQNYKMGKTSDIAFWTWAARQWRLNKSVAELIELLVSGYEINQEACDFVHKVRKVGFKTLICTNNFPARIHGLDKKFKFLEDFDVVVTSYEEGYVKPDKGIFETLVKKSGVDASEIVMADDDPTKLDGAKELGVNVLLYKDFPTFIGDLEKLGVVV